MSFLAELKRRNVYRVGIAYLAASWLALQLADVVLENLELPGWLFRALLVVIAVGFPIALALAWALERTPEGLRRESAAPAQNGAASITQYIQLGLIIGLAIAVGVLIVDKFQDDGAPPAAQRAGTLERSIAVLPLVNRSGVEADMFFVDGMHDDLLTQLAKLDALDKVIAREAVSGYRGTDKTTREIGTELGVATLLTGSVERAGENVRVRVQLADASTDSVLWADSWTDRLTAENLFSIQSAIAEDVVLALQGVLSVDDRNQIRSQPTQSLEAYEQYVLGRNEMARRTSESLSRALAHYQRAVEIDPDYALAWVGVADALALQATYSGIPSDESFTGRQRAIDRALALDPVSGEAYTALAELRNDQGEVEAAESYFVRAIELNPNYETARHWYALLLRGAGRLDEAIRQIEKARDINPNAAVLFVAESAILGEAEQLQAADASLAEGIRKHPDYAGLYGARAEVNYLWGHFADSLRWADRAVEIAPTAADARLGQCLMQVELGLAELAASCVAALSEDFPDRFGFGLTPASFALAVQQRQLERFLLPPSAVEQLPAEAQSAIVAAYFLNGQRDAAGSLIEQTMPEMLEIGEEPLPGYELNMAFIVAEVLEEAGDISAADRQLRRIEAAIAEDSGRGGGRAFARTFLEVGRRNFDAAAAEIDRAIETGEIQGWYYFRAPAFEAAFSRPEFAAAVERLESEIARQRADYLADPDLPPI